MGLSHRMYCSSLLRLQASVGFRSALIYFIQLLHVCWSGFFKARRRSGFDCVGSLAFRIEISLSGLVWSGRLEASTHVLQFSMLGRFSYVARWAEISEFSESLSLFHEVLVTKLWETRNWDGTKCLELQNPLIFFASLIMGSALLPMATNRKEFALLGGTFLFGLGALEMVLRMGGYWDATFVVINLSKWKTRLSQYIVPDHPVSFEFISSEFGLEKCLAFLCCMFRLSSNIYCI